VTRFAQAERLALADLLLDLGPDQPTLCEGWTTRDLAAHVVARERRPDAGAGIVVPFLRAHGERVRGQLATRPYAELVAMVRVAPWWSPVSNPLLEPLTNTVEFFVHHEDVRRGQPGWQPRSLTREEERALWTPVATMGRFALRRFRAAIALQAPGYGERAAGAGGDRVRVIGAPGELAMFLTGRQRAARVQLDGPPETVARLRAAPLGL
jgi:uncharacterized protein (TIGR03085 family)